jgi:hypothetical protein
MAGPAQEQENVYQQVLGTGRLSAKQPIDLKKIFATEFLDKANGIGNPVVQWTTLMGKQIVEENP